MKSPAISRNVVLCATEQVDVDQIFAQFSEILDNSIMHDGDRIGGVRVCIAFGRPAMRSPAGMANAGIAAERLGFQPGFQRLKLALGASTRQHAMIKRCDARRVIATVFEALERIDQLVGHRLDAENSYDPTHPPGRLLY